MSNNFIKIDVLIKYNIPLPFNFDRGSGKKCFWFYSAQVYAVVENRGTNSDHYMYTVILI